MAIVADVGAEAPRKWLIGELQQGLRDLPVEEFSGDLEVTKGFQRLSVPQGRVRSAKDLAIVGWDFFVQGESGLVLVSISANEGFALRAVHSGGFVERALDFAERADVELADKQSDYRAALVDASDASVISWIFIPEDGPSRCCDIVDGTLVKAFQYELALGAAQLIRKIEQRKSDYAPYQQTLEQLLD